MDFKHRKPAVGCRPQQASGERVSTGAIGEDRLRTGRLLKLIARSYRNARMPFHFAYSRLLRSGLPAPTRSWLPWLVAYALVLAAGFLILDPVAGSHRAGWPQWLVSLAVYSTDAGLGGWYIVPALAWLLVANLTDWRSLSLGRRVAYRDRTALAFFVLWCTAFSGILTTVLKQVFGRARPLHFDEYGAFAFKPLSLDPYFLGFPSGHATTVGGVTMMLVLLSPRLRWPLLALALWVAATRVFLDAHFPTDVLAGFGFGAAFALLGAMLFARMGFIFRHDGSGLPRRRSTFKPMGRETPMQGQEASNG